MPNIGFYTNRSFGNVISQVVLPIDMIVSDLSKTLLYNSFSSLSFSYVRFHLVYAHVLHELPPDFVPMELLVAQMPELMLELEVYFPLTLESNQNCV